MQWKNQIPLIMAISALAFMIVLGQNINVAYAISASYDFNLSGVTNQCDIMKGGTLFYMCIPDESASASHTVTWFTSNTNPPTIHTLVVYPQNGGCSSPSNPCSASSGSVSDYTTNHNLTGQSGTLGGIWCGITDCFTLWITADSYSSQLLRITPTSNKVTGYMNITATTELRPLLTGIDFNTGGIGGISVYYLRCPATCSATSTGILVKVSGTSQMGEVSTVDTSMFFKGSGSSTNGWGTVSLDICWFCDGNSSNNTNNKLVILTSRQAVTTNRAVEVIKADTMSVLCSATNSGGGFTSSQNAGISRFLNSTRFLYATDDNIYSVNLTSCAKVSTTAYSTLGLANYVSAISTKTVQTLTASDPTMHSYGGLLWIHSGTSAGLSTLTQVNATTLNTLVNFDNTVGSSIQNYVTGSNPVNSLVSDVVSKTLVRTDIVNKAEIIYLDGFTNPSSSGSTGSTNGTCGNLDTNGDGLYGTVLDCLGDRSALSLITGATPLQNNTSTFLQSIGIANASDDNPQTNGTGLLMMLGLMGVMGGGAMITAKKANYLISDIHPIVWLLIALGVTGASWQLGWTDSIPFYAMIVVCAGIGAFGLYQKFGNRG